MNDHPHQHTRLSAKFRRVAALVRKESRQIFRDPSSVAIGVVLPLLLILLFGYGLSLDVTNVPVAIVLEDPSPEATGAAASFELSSYFNPRTTTSMAEAEPLDERAGRSTPSCAFGRISASQVRLAKRRGSNPRPRGRRQYGPDHPNLRRGAARPVERARQAAEGKPPPSGPVVVQNRLWFNDANDSHYFLVPGLVVLVMTLIGALLTALVMAREWERGTLEALFVTPVRSDEILLGKTIPYFVLGMIGWLLCILAAQYLFHVPLRGSVSVLAGASMLYLLVALSIGLLISSATKSQFVSSQMTIVVTFLPAMMLSGFLFDLHSIPIGVRIVTYLVPARYFVAILQTVFLAGDIWPVILPSLVVLAGMAAVLLDRLTRNATRKTLS